MDHSLDRDERTSYGMSKKSNSESKEAPVLSIPMFWAMSFELYLGEFNTVDLSYRVSQ